MSVDDIPNHAAEKLGPVETRPIVPTPPTPGAMPAGVIVLVALLDRAPTMSSSTTSPFSPIASFGGGGVLAGSTGASSARAVVAQLAIIIIAMSARALSPNLFQSVIEAPLLLLRAMERPSAFPNG